jgi:hypothetical protein
VLLELLNAAAFRLRICISVNDGLQYVTSLRIFMFPKPDPTLTNLRDVEMKLGAGNSITITSLSHG